MATYYLIGGSVTALGALLDTGGAGAGYFEDISYVDRGSGQKQIVCQSGLLYFRLGGNTNYVYNWNVEGESGTTVRKRQSSDGDDETDYEPMHAYVCEKGISIVCSRARILITKTNNNKTVVAFGNVCPGTAASSTGVAVKTAAVMSEICCIADGDEDTYKGLTNNVKDSTYDRLFNQTLIIPIPTQAGFGTVSYTNHAGLVLLPQTRDICNFTYNNKRYFSDGYFAIEDEEVST